MIKPRRIVAIGRDAGIALNGLDIAVEIVRHPSYGGQAEFSSGVNRIYGLAAGDDGSRDARASLLAGDSSGERGCRLIELCDHRINVGPAGRLSIAARLVDFRMGGDHSERADLEARLVSDEVH